MLLMGTSTISTGPWLQVRKLLVITRGYSQWIGRPASDHLKKRGGLRRWEMNWWGINRDKNYGDDFPFSWEFPSIPTDFHSIIFQRGRVETTNQVWWGLMKARFQSFFMDHLLGEWTSMRDGSARITGYIPCDHWTLGYGKWHIYR